MTELIWEGKYDEHGRRRAPLRVALPFQTVETVNESAQERQRALDLFSTGRDPEWRNRLIWGDKKYVLPALLEEFAGQVDLIYIDPPFNTGADFSFQVQVDGEDFTKEPSVIEQKAYRDTWGRGGVDQYLKWFYETVVLLRELLAETGSIYVHLDWHVGHYAKIVLDEVFGIDRFVNEICWKRQSAKSGAFEGIGQYGRIHESILFYAKSESWVWNQQYAPYDEEYVEGFYKYVEPETGRRYRLSDLTAPESRRGESGGPLLVNGETIFPAPGRHWALGLKPGETVQDAMTRLIREARIWHEPGKMPAYKRYFDEMPGVMLQDVWTDVRPVPAQGTQRRNYPTQKPEALLERIIKTSSNEGDLVLDCFVGSGTTAAVAEKVNRRWIAADLSRFAIHTTRKCLLGIPNVRPFIVQNLGKYERQVWQKAEFGDTAEARQAAYRQFILDLYHARPISGHTWLHGVQAGRMIYVGSVDSPVSPGDVQQIIIEFKRMIGTGAGAPTTNGVDVLGWDFAFELNEVAKQQAALANVDLRFHLIPRDVMDKRAVEQGDVSFYELAALSVDVLQKGRDVTLTLTDFIIPPDYVPKEIQQAINSWAQWIDYWAVDWDNKGDTFHNQWQTYRTRKNRELQKSASITYEKPGDYVVVVKVIDILGNDTTKTLKVQVP